MIYADEVDGRCGQGGDEMATGVESAVEKGGKGNDEVAVERLAGGN